MSSQAINLRIPSDRDAFAIHDVHARAFSNDAEARLVAALTANGEDRVSLLAEVDAPIGIVGHVLFSPVTLDMQEVDAVGLAPLAILPEFQRRGIGQRLARAGIEACRERGIAFVVVLGDPRYYERFGFRRASALGIANEYGADESFMVLELREGGLPSGGGTARYASAFADL